MNCWRNDAPAAGVRRRPPIDQTLELPVPGFNSSGTGPSRSRSITSAGAGAASLRRSPAVMLEYADDDQPPALPKSHATCVCIARARSPAAD